MKLQDMTGPEKQALRSLVRVMVGVDGSYSPEETATLQRAASELGEEAFWELVSEPGQQELTMDLVKARAREVERPEVRETIYGMLFGLAAAGSIVGEEGRILDWLAATWDLEVS